MARTYKRDALGRFAGGGGGGGRPKARSVARGANRLTRDNAGRITSVGGDGATARGGRLRTAGGKQRAVQTARIGANRGGVAAKPKGLRSRPGGRPASALNPAQVAGQRKRASETQEAFALRKLPQVRSRINHLSQNKDRLQTDLARRRGKLEGEDRRTAARNLAKTKQSLSRLKDAEQAYKTSAERRAFERSWNLDRRTKRKAPSNARTARNQFNMLRNRVRFLRREEAPRYDAFGLRYAGPRLDKAKKQFSDSVFTLKGQRVSIRSKAAAAAAQRRTANRNIAKSNIMRPGSTRNIAETSQKAFKKLIIGTSRQGDLLTNEFTRVRSGRPRRR